MRRNLLLLLSLLLLSQLIIAKPLPVEAYASLPEIRNAIISPDGNKIAALLSLEKDGVKGTVISILDLKSGTEDFPLFSDNKKFILSSLAWANNQMLLITAIFPASRYGTHTTESRLLKFNLKSKSVASVLSKSLLKRFNYMPQIQSNVIDYLPADNNHILLAIGGHEPEAEPSVIKVNLDKGKTRYIQPAIKHFRHWLTDQQHRVRIGIYRKDSSYIIYERDDPDKEFRVLWEFENFSKDEVWPLGFATNPQQLYVRALHQGRDAIFLVDLSSPTLTRKLILADDQYDVDGRILYSESGKVIGTTFNKGSGFNYWDEEYLTIQKAINKAVPKLDNYLVSFSADTKKYIALSTNDSKPGIYLLGDRVSNRLTMISPRYPALETLTLPTKKLISYTARDGLKIEGYLTLPNNQSKTNLPTIIFPHGGPISYDGRGFDYWTQFFVSRGYAVLQMNFRGSSGYGFDFMQAGLKGWGLAMQDDVEDATKWIINRGTTDPARICIVGASYGGYAALMATVKSPDLYQCAISFAGVSDVEYLVRSSRKYTSHEIVKKQIGEDYEKLSESSPINFVKKISTPILLIHGTKDRVVRVEHSEKMHQALKLAKKEVKYISLEKGNHHLSNNEHRIKTFKEMEAFLEKHLKPRK